MEKVPSLVCAVISFVPTWGNPLLDSKDHGARDVEMEYVEISKFGC
jgi:hypothetical protein